MSLPSTPAAESLSRLFELVRHLRSPAGCPWDREQGLEDLRAYLLEEAHEVATAIDSKDWDEVCSELGDLCFQIVFIVVLAEEKSAFRLENVIDRIEQKMIARHPHVFGHQALADSEAVHQAWEQRKRDDAAKRRGSLLDGLPSSLPALVAAYRLSQKAAGIGFDWPSPQAVLSKVDEELAELRHEVNLRGDSEPDPRIRDELGDLLFTLASLSRHLGMDPEAALAQANAKFRRRFGLMETALDEQGVALDTLDPEAMEAAWQAAKQQAAD